MSLLLSSESQSKKGAREWPPMHGPWALRHHSWRDAAILVVQARRPRPRSPPPQPRQPFTAAKDLSCGAARAPRASRSRAPLASSGRALHTTRFFPYGRVLVRDRYEGAMCASLRSEPRGARHR
eukprot:365077-Chlamydomonas_euryale.AAC.2